MKTAILVNSHVDLFEPYKEQYKLFEDKTKAIAFAKSRAVEAGIPLFLLNSISDLKIGYLISAEGGKKYVRVIEIE